MNSQALKESVRNLPDAPGVYFFLGPKKPARPNEAGHSGREILYIGKATSLCDRVKSYFSRDLIKTRGQLLVRMVEDAVDIDFIETDSVLEALLLEAHLIRKHNPFHNSKEKDNKSFNTIVVTDEDYPAILIVRARNLAHWNILKKGMKIKASYGPFPHGGELREALKIIRRIFPYRDEKCGGPNAKRPCFNFQIGLCPGVCLPAQAGAGVISKREYRKTVKRMQLFFEGKKSELIKDIEKEMKSLAKEQKFEEADKLKRTLYALEHIQDVALIKRDMERVESEDVFRIEAYDIAHLSGKDAVGVMTVVEDGELAKSQYRKFKIKIDKNDDTKNLKEILSRRLNHPEWRMPNLIVIDGGVGQLNAVKEVLKEKGLDIDAVSVVKDDRHKAREVLGASGDSSENSLTPSLDPARDRTPPPRIFSLSPELKRDVLLANVEAHRFAIGYHRKLRSKGFRI